MALSAVESELETKNVIRKYRKKLRQVEHLERLNRPLSPEETKKVNSKHNFRSILQELLLNYVEEEEQSSKITGTDTAVQNEDFNTDLSYQKEQEQTISTFISCGTEVVGNVLLNNESEDTLLRTPENDDGSKHQHTFVPTASGDEKKPQKKKSFLPSSHFKVNCLEGHCDIITAVVIHQEVIVTASRDTTVKTWNLHTGELLKNFGGHTDRVSCLLVIKTASKGYVSGPELITADDAIIVSGSYDCTLKLWSLSKGQLLKSVYTYNPISQISFLAEIGVLVLGSETGKIELWDLEKGEKTHSIYAFDAAVTGIQVVNRLIHTCDSDGLVKVFSLTDNGQLACVFESEDIQVINGTTWSRRHVRSVEVCERGLLIGDDARNIKLLNWRKNEAEKIPNHHSDYSSTDAMRCSQDLFFASSYDLDSGLGYLNVRCLPSLEYVGSLDDSNTERIFCLDFSTLNNGNVVVVTGGAELKVWEILKQKLKGKCNDDVLQVELRQRMMEQAVDSENDDDDEEEEYENNDGIDNEVGKKCHRLVFQQEEQGSWMSWCSIL